MADDDRQNQPDGYGFGLARESAGFGYLSGALRGSVTFQVSAALALAETITVAASHKTRRLVVGLGLSEVITIAASHTSGSSPAFDVTIDGPYGSANRGDSPSFLVNYTASPTGQTSAQVYVYVSGQYASGDNPAVVVGVSWSDGPATGWSISTDWTAGPNVGDFYSILTKAALVTSNYIGQFDTQLNLVGNVPGGFYCENDYQPTATASHTATATSLIHVNTNTVIA